MKIWVLALGLATALATGAQAADLDEGPPPDRRGSAYDDPRYGDMYRLPPRPPGYGTPPPRDYADREDDDEDDLPPRRPYGYSEGRPPYAGGPPYGRPYAQGNCVPREMIKDRLLRHGWSDFHDGDLQGNLATVHARRPSGRLFMLTIDRCSGEIVEARPLEGRPYAYSGPGRRWDRGY